MFSSRNYSLGATATRGVGGGPRAGGSRVVVAAAAVIAIVVRAIGVGVVVTGALVGVST